ncbi:MAG: DUF4288 domain-containing protein [Chitinophagaceae bacterium]
MKWYLVKVIFRIICGEGTHTAQFDEQLRIIEAEDEKTAFSKAQQFGINEEQGFLNMKQQIVQWKFVNVAELYLLNEFIDGAELYSSIYETDDADAYTQLTHQRAKNIQCIETHKLLQLI